MAVETADKLRIPQKADKKSLPETEGLILEADYEEDRPNSLLAERQRTFQKIHPRSLRRHENVGGDRQHLPGKAA